MVIVVLPEISSITELGSTLRAVICGTPVLSLFMLPEDASITELGRTGYTPLPNCPSHGPLHAVTGQVLDNLVSLHDADIIKLGSHLWRPSAWFDYAS